VPEGFAVLNAADPVAAAMAEHCKGKVVLFGGSPESTPTAEHLAGGGAALVRLGSQLVWCHRAERYPPFSLSTLTESTDVSSVEPLMAAAAAVLALGVSRAAVQSFLSNSGY
jgi:cyanophycin synthetase